MSRRIEFMSKLSHILCRRVVLIFITIHIVLLSGCAAVQRWEREYLSDPMMIFNEDSVENNVHQLVYDSREGSTGGYGVSGGGCACSQ